MKIIESLRRWWTQKPKPVDAPGDLSKHHPLRYRTELWDLDGGAHPRRLDMLMPGQSATVVIIDDPAPHHDCIDGDPHTCSASVRFWSDVAEAQQPGPTRWVRPS